MCVRDESVCRVREESACVMCVGRECGMCEGGNFIIFERRVCVLCVGEEFAMCEECACVRVLYRRGRQVCIRHKCAHLL